MEEKRQRERDRGRDRERDRKPNIEERDDGEKIGGEAENRHGRRDKRPKIENSRRKGELVRRTGEER
jgi:hypothetical protein